MLDGPGSSSVAISSNGIRVPALRRPPIVKCNCVDMARSAGTLACPFGQQKPRRAVIEDRRGPRKMVLWHPAQLATQKPRPPRVHWD